MRPIVKSNINTRFVSGYTAIAKFLTTSTKPNNLAGEFSVGILNRDPKKLLTPRQITEILKKFKQ